MAKSQSNTDRLINQTGEKIKDGKFPFEIYSNEDIYQEELRRLFSRTWNYIGHTSEFQEPGDYARRYIAGDPYILTYDRDGEYHALLDACKHRGAQFCTADKGNTTHFRCPYHGWTYRNDGELQGMPYKEESYQDLDTDEISLEKANVDIYNGLIFGRLVDEGPSLEEYLGDFTWYLDLLCNITEEGMTVVADPHKSVAPHNWKTPAQNFGGDNYHVLATHQAVFESEDLGEAGPWEKLPSARERKGDYNHLAVTENASLSFLVNYDEDTHLGYPDEITEHYNSKLSEDQRELFSQSVYYFSTLYPNTNINHAISGGGWGGPWMQIRTFVPRGPSETEIMSWWLVPKELADDDEFMERAYHGFETTSPGGTFESDDLSVWAGIAESTDSVTMELNETVGNMEQGLEGMSDDLETVDDPMFGPAEVQRFGGYYSEAGARNHLKHWHKYMSMGRPETAGSSADE